MKRWLLIILLILLAMPRIADAQGFGKRIGHSDVDWKKNRLIGMFSVGASNYLGELGGADAPRSDFLGDLEFEETKYVTGIGLGYVLSPLHMIRTQFFYGRVSGDDKLTNFKPRQDRNLHFRSVIIEWSITYQIWIFRPKTKHIVANPASGAFAGNRFGAYLFGGTGVFYFNPKAQYESQWVALQPLGTEGQGLEGGGQPYKRTALAWPMGGAFTFLLNPSVNLILEFGIRLTSTDYLDDASTKYFDNAAIRRERGPIAADLANPHISVDNALQYQDGTIRGNPDDNDSYMFMHLTVAKNIGNIYRSRKIKNKKKGKNKSLKNPKNKKSRKNRKKRKKKYFKSKKEKGFKKFLRGLFGSGAGRVKY